MCDHCFHECKKELKVFCCRCYKEWYSCDYLEQNDECNTGQCDCSDRRNDIYWVDGGDKWIGTFATSDMMDSQNNYT